MADVLPGDTVEIGFARGERAPCVTVNGRSECDTAIGADAGWTLLFSPEGLTRVHKRAIGALWMIALGGLIGLAPWRPVVRGAAVGTAAVLALALPAGLPYLSTSLLPVATLGVGAGIGMILRPTVVSP